MRHHQHWFIIGLIIIFSTKSSSHQCDRTPERIIKPPNNIDIDRYLIEIAGHPKTYIPGESYHITLKANPLSRSKPEWKRFVEFMLVAEPATTLGTFQTSPTGNFHLINQMMTRFHTECRNTVIQTSNLPKNRIDVTWVAPVQGSGCIAFRATVVESSDNWFSDSGQLTKILCEAAENPEVQPAVLDKCCACEEAKYEIAFQGLWSRNTHPRHYPADGFVSKFSDIVGASHKVGKSFWNYNELASPGVVQIAEDGDTKVLESELKAMVKSDDIRTIIKARELAYPYNTGTSYTVFRVDKDNHVISLMSKITPSPDWVVGVANLELCLENCSWVESRTLNLYPWDVGTDSGVSYYSPDSPVSDAAPITRIEPHNESEASPFFNPDGEPIKPFAKLLLTRQKLYEKECENVGEEGCETSEWSSWSRCSDDCVKVRSRTYLNPQSSKSCQMHLIETAECSSNRHCRHRGTLDEDAEKCQVGEWSEWSSCSTTCGRGVRMRERALIHLAYESSCSKVELQETEECDNEEECEETQEDDGCSDRRWSEWSPCSVSCGNGTRERFRLPLFEEEEDSCFKETVSCFGPSCEEDVFGSMESGSHNNIPVIEEGPDGPVIDCKVTRWFPWSPCDALPCKKGHQTRKRYIKIHPRNGGKNCPRKLQTRRKCKAPCPDKDSRETLPTWGPSQPLENVTIDCQMGDWSQWSPCSATCGSSAVQQRTRSILVYPSRNGKRCGTRVQYKKCRLPLACNDFY